MNPFLANLKRQAEENPIPAIVVGLAALSAVNKLVGTRIEMRNSAAWQKEVARRAMKDAIK